MPLNELPFCHLNDDEFHLALLEMCHGTINFDPDRLSSLQFNPLDRRYNNIANFFYSDPDRNFYPESFNCDYYIQDEFIESLVDNVRNLKYCSFLHLNIRSLSVNGPFAASGHMVYAGGQAAHWDIQNKENSNLF